MIQATWAAYPTVWRYLNPPPPPLQTMRNPPPPPPPGLPQGALQVLGGAQSTVAACSMPLGLVRDWKRSKPKSKHVQPQHAAASNFLGSCVCVPAPPTTTLCLPC